MRSLSYEQIEQTLKSNILAVYQSESAPLSFEGLTFDSRKVIAKGIFVAMAGTNVDGWDFVPQALESGAGLIIGQRTLNEEEQQLISKYHCSYIQVRRVSLALADLANIYWDKPSQDLKLVGVTGTNGKTTTATLLYRLFSQLGYTSGLIGTIENRIGDQVIPATHTTPDALTLNELLHQMREAKCSYVFMEVSSHAVVQERIGALTFAGGIFTNLSRDHLDYHKTMAEYIKAKKGFFDLLPKDSFALVNADDRNGLVMTQNSSAKTYTYSLQRPADFAIKVVESDLCGMQLLINEISMWTPLVGNFNAYNLGVVYATASLLLPNMQREHILSSLSTIKAAEGRFEVVSSQGATAIVDYAHTPDALIKVLETIRPLLKKGKKLITVVGAGGNRDKGKRPIMAQESFKRSDLLILTSDNPRFEEPQEILNDMLEGISIEERENVRVIVDRKEAIQTALTLANDGDVVLVAGKGHETYQEIKGVRHHFDDREIIRLCIN